MNNLTGTAATLTLSFLPSNTTETATNGTDAGMHILTEPFGLRVVRLFLYAVIFFVAVIGNCLVIMVVYKTPSLRSGRG